MGIRISPEVLVWARQTAGLTVEDAAKKLGLTSSARSTAVQKLEAMEAGEKQPSQSQLNAFANLYKRPLITFYLSEPPKAGKRGQDFRQTPEARGARDNGMLDALLRDVKARQEMVRDILLEEEDRTPLEFVGSATRDDGIDRVVSQIAERLQFDNTDLSLRKGGPTELFGRLRVAAEQAGVFVLVLGDLGSHHTTISASVFRGFAIADDVAPFVVINAKDARPARAFTLVHELAHIWLGQTGVSGNISTAKPSNASARIERFCNDVSGEFLLPESHFRQAATKFEPNDVEGARACIDLVASRWSVSEPMVAYRYQRRGELTATAYETLRKEYHQRWLANVARERQKRGENDSGPSGYVMKQFYLGNALIDVVNRGFRDKSLTHTKAAKLLGGKALAVPGFLGFVEDNRRKRRSSGVGVA